MYSTTELSRLDVVLMKGRLLIWGCVGAGSFGNFVGEEVGGGGVK